MGGGLPGSAARRMLGGAVVVHALARKILFVVSGTWHWRQLTSSGCGTTGA
jgi:hypothetical protein